MIFIGCDPDVHSIGFAAVNEHYKPVFLGCCKSMGATDTDAIEMLVGEQRTWLKDYSGLKALENVMAIAVEAQDHYLGSTPNPKSISLLAAAAGATLQLLHGCWPAASLRFVKPVIWKKQIPKVIHHARIYKRVGWEYKKSANKKRSDQYCWPIIPPFQRDILGLETVKNKGDWKHVGDALGIALWLRDRYKLKDESKPFPSGSTVS